MTEREGEGTLPAVKAPNIGIITALPKEFAAVRVMLDNPREDYTMGHRVILGTMPAGNGEVHHVALAVCPEMANNAAAVLTKDMLRAFPSIFEIVMVGIAGGAPNHKKPDEHVRLGDVVFVNSSGIVQYDLIKEELDANSGKPEFTHRYHPVRPSNRLLQASQQLESDSIAGEKNWIAEFRRFDLLPKYQRPAAETDILYDAEQVIHHPPRNESGEPKIHRGVIGSANILQKNPRRRDELRDRFGIRAFEMEASGVADACWSESVDVFVVRGICDYADDHKNDTWQFYAAGIAAACTRALLRFVVPKTFEPSRRDDRPLNPSPMPSDDGSDVREEIVGHFGTKLKEIFDLIKTAGPNRALSEAEGLEAEISRLSSVENEPKLWSGLHRVKARCYALLRRDQEAAREFEKAYSRTPQHLQTARNHGMGLMLAGKPEDALKHLDSLLQQHPNDLQTKAHKAAVLASQDRYREVLQLLGQRDGAGNRIIPTNSDQARLLGHALFEFKKYADAKRAFQGAIDAGTDNPLNYFMLAQLLLVPESKVLSGPSVEGEAARRQGLAYLDQAVVGFQTLEDNENLALALALRAQLSARTPNSAPADQDIKRAIELAPNHPGVARSYGEYVFSQKLPDEAVADLEAYWAEHPSYPIATWLLYTHIRANQNLPQGLVDKLRAKVEEFPQDAAEVDAFRRAVVHALARSGDEKQASSLFDQWEVKDGEAVERWLLLKFDLAVARQDQAAAKTILDGVSANSDELLIAMAVEAAQHGWWQLAHAAHQKHGINEKSGLFAQRHYVRVLNALGSDYFQELNEFAQKVRSAGITDPEILHAEIRCRQRTFDHDKVIELCALMEKQSDVAYPLPRVDAYMALGQRDEAKKVLDVVAQRRLDIDTTLGIVRRYDKICESEAALELLHKLWRHNREDVDVAESYFWLGLKSHLNQPAEVVEDTAVRLSFPDGSTITYFITNDSNRRDNEYPTNSAVGQRLMGRRVGDQLDWAQGGHEQKATITEIAHKHHYGSRKAREMLDQHPDNRAVRRFTFDHQQPNQVLAQINRVALEDMPQGQQGDIVEIYRNSLLSVAALAQAHNKSVLEVWHLVADKSVGIWACSNLFEEQEAEKKAVEANQKKKVVVTFDVLLVLANLHRLEDLTRFFSGVLVAQKTYDEFVAEVERLGAIHEDVLYFIPDPVRPQFVRVPLAEIEQRRERLVQIQKFIQTNCQLFPSPRVPKTEETRTELALGRSSFDSVLKAAESDLALLSDSAATRIWARKDYGVTSAASSFAWLRFRREVGDITEAAFGQAIEQLIDLGYQYLAFDPQTLMTVNRFAPQVLPHALLAAADLRNSPESRVGVLAEFLYQLALAGELQPPTIDLVCQMVVKRDGVASLRGMVRYWESKQRGLILVPSAQQLITHVKSRIR